MFVNADENGDFRNGFKSAVTSAIKAAGLVYTHFIVNAIYKSNVMKIN